MNTVCDLYIRVLCILYVFIVDIQANNVFSTYSLVSASACGGLGRGTLWTLNVRSSMKCVHYCAIDVSCEFICYNKNHGICIGLDYCPPAIADSSKTLEWTSYCKKFPASDCDDYFNEGFRVSEVYKIYPAAPNRTISFNVYCDMDSFDGGLTVFQHRHDGSEDFYRTWNEYKEGFGDLRNEFWIGNDKLHQMTSYKNQRLYILMTDVGDVTRYVTYDNFVIENEAMDYMIRIGAFAGTDVDNFRAGPKWNVDGMRFSTKDVDNDLRSHSSCAVQFTGAWWYNDCMASNLNGQYYSTCSSLPSHDKKCNYWSGTGPMTMTKMMVKKI